MKPKVPPLSDDERATIFENLIHDLAAMDTTNEEQARAINQRLVAEGRIDPDKTADAHRRLLARLGVGATAERLIAGDLVRSYETHRGVSREEIARELGVDLQALGQLEGDTTPVPASELGLVEAGRALAQRFHANAAGVLSALRLGRMRLLESIAEPGVAYACKDQPK